MKPKQCNVIAKVVGNGKITIPQDVRNVLGIKDGDFVGAVVWKIDMSAPGEDE